MYKLLEHYLNSLYENIIFSSNNIYYQYEKFIDSNNGKLFITGYTGSGKSTLASKLANKHNIRLIELDNYIEIDQNKVKRYKEKKDFEGLRQYYQRQLDNTIINILSKSEKVIIEGLQIFLLTNINILKHYSIIVVNTSALKSFIRAFARNIKDKDYLQRVGYFGIADDIFSNLFIKKVEKFINIIKQW